VVEFRMDSRARVMVSELIQWRDGGRVDERDSVPIVSFRSQDLKDENGLETLGKTTSKR
jgi:hypothetical protein